jgi:hypothetical protein
MLFHVSHKTLTVFANFYLWHEKEEKFSHLKNWVTKKVREENLNLFIEQTPAGVGSIAATAVGAAMKRRRRKVSRRLINFRFSFDLFEREIYFEASPLTTLTTLLIRSKHHHQHNFFKILFPSFFIEGAVGACKESFLSCIFILNAIMYVTGC